MAAVLSPFCLPLSLSLDLKTLMKNKQDGKHLLLQTPSSPSLLHPHVVSLLRRSLLIYFRHLGKKRDSKQNRKSAAPALTKWLHSRKSGDICLDTFSTNGNYNLSFRSIIKLCLFLLLHLLPPPRLLLLFLLLLLLLSLHLFPVSPWQ